MGRREEERKRQERTREREIGCKKRESEGEREM